jgi:histidinol-phosphate aminotransferase
VAAVGVGLRPPPLTAAPRGTSEAPIRLDSNENPYGPSEAARQAILAALREGNRYPDPTPLEERIAAREGLTREHVVLAAGSQAILCMAGLAYGLEGGEILAADPTYPGMVAYAQAVGAHVHRVGLAAGEVHDLSEMERRLTQAVRLIFVCNPNNPTGTIVPGPQLRAFCERAARRAVVLVDEAYAEYADSAAFTSMADLVRKGENVVVSRTFSKIHGLAGLRVGYALARPDIADRLRRYRMGGDRMAVNVLGLRAALASYDDRAFVETSRARNAEAREYLVAALRQSGLTPPESHANFVYFRLPAGRRPPALAERMARRGILVVAREDIGGCRVTLGTMAEVRAFAQALPEVLRT